MSDINVTVQDEIVNIDVIDEPVLVNVVNSPGQQGPAGPGVPVGGTAGQILAKASATDYDTEWINNYAKYLATNVRNQTGSTIGAFQVVYISGATGNKPLISLADADTEATSSKTYGVTATAIANNGTGDVVTAGELSGINTSAFNEGDLLWLSTTAGGVVTTPPAEPAHAVFIGYVIRSHPTLGVVDVAIANGYELNELHGVQITSAANNDGLFYNSSNSLWENKSIATVLGYTPEQPLTFNSPLSRSVNAVSIPQATGSVNGFLSATDWTTFNSKQAALGFTPANAATTLTINGVTFDLSANRTWTVAAGISGSGAAGQVTYWTGASAVSGSNNLFWDAANNRLGIGTNTPAYTFDIPANNTNNIQYRVGTFQIQSYGLNNGFLSDNMYFNGTSWARTTTGFGYGFQFYNGQLMLHGASTSSGIFTQNVKFKFDYEGAFVIGNNLNVTQGNYSGATALFTKTGNLILNSPTLDGGQRFQVYGDTLLRGSGATSATTALTVQNSDSTNLFVVRNDGNVGIGTNAPSTRVDVVLPNGVNNVSQGFRLSKDTGLFEAVNGTSNAGGFVPVFLGRANYDASGLSFQGRLFNNASLNPAILFETYNFSASSGLATGQIILGISNATTRYLNIYSNGNMVLQAGGTFTDGGQRLQVYGDTLLRGSGNTSATTALTVQNSSSTNLLRVLNNGNVSFGADAMFWDNANGRLGIGTNAPISKIETYQESLYIAGAFSMYSDTASDEALFYFRRGRGTLASPSTVLTGDTIGSLRFAVQYNAIVGGYNTNAKIDSVVETNGANLRFHTNSGGLGSSTISEKLRIFGNGNVLIQNGGIFTDLGQRLQVYGDTLLRGSGATSATTALTVQNSSSTNLFTVRNDGYAAINYNGTSAAANAGLEIISTSATATAMSSLAINGNSATGHKFLISHIGTNSSAYLQNYSTSASNYRGIFFLGNELTFEVTNTDYASRIQALRVNVSGYVGINNISPTALTDIGASTTARASLRIRSGTAPTTPNDGDIWFDGTDIKMRIGGVTKTFTLV